MKHKLRITYSGEPHISADDLPLARELERRGFEVRARPWDGAEQHGADPATVVIRSPWNYDSALTGFLRWIDGLEHSGHRAINPASLVRWNIHKGYLLEAARRGLPIPQTALLPRSAAELDNVMDLVKRGSTLVLMELELIDPVLFFGWAPESASRLADLLSVPCLGHQLAVAARDAD